MARQEPGSCLVPFPQRGVVAMKAGIVAGFVALVFVGGIAVGAAFLGDRAAPRPGPANPAPGAALAESDRLRRAPGRADGRGDGQVVDLSGATQTPAERKQWEDDRRASWEARLTREREIKVRTLKERCQLTAAQESQLVLILE